jgi:hypothetical protein
MRMSVKQLRAFLAVAHTQFRARQRTAESFQPALSLTIKGWRMRWWAAAAAQHAQGCPDAGGGNISADGPAAAGRLG